jgi:hypothetical protein
MRNPFEKPAEEPKNNADNPEHAEARSKARRRPFSGIRKRLIAGALLAAGGLAAQDQPKEQLKIIPPFTKGQQGKPRTKESPADAERIRKQKDFEVFMEKVKNAEGGAETAAPESQTEVRPVPGSPHAEIQAPPRTPEASRKDFTEYHDELTAHMNDAGYSGSALVKEAEALTRMAEGIVMKTEKDKQDLKKNLDTALGIVKSTHTKSSGEAKTKIEKDYKKAVAESEVRVVKAKMAIVDAQVARSRGLARVKGQEEDRMMGGKK